MTGPDRPLSGQGKLGYVLYHGKKHQIRKPLEGTKRRIRRQGEERRTRDGKESTVDQREAASKVVE